MSVLSSQTLIKLTGWSRKYNFEFGNFAEFSEDSQTISTYSVASSPSGLTIGVPAVSGTQVQVSVAGGSAATVYTLTCTITTSAGSTLSVAGKLQVES